MSAPTSTGSRLDRVLERLKLILGDKLLSVVTDKKIVKLSVAPEALVEAAATLKEMGFDHVKGVTGVDLIALKQSERAIELIYHAGSYLDNELAPYIVNLSTKLPRDNPVAPSLVKIWPSADYHERETYEMLGVIFEGHPNLKRLLLPEWWSDIPPLRKDYKPPGRE
ncbi:MAG: NADH-quinone oxidoreductase subunit C [Nitrososphaerota archaeon]|nr:NADH-quinone oxidoreductase subunit C [Candidatus Calditenuaceae archaeon]MDW8073725.1 NADH-quinone oxidoreductase subunit C [Nitrososphaerota archaeon]